VNDLHYAVVVGINRYPGISDLGGARADADQFAAWLVDPEGGALPDENVKRVSVTEDDEAGYDSADAARPTGDEVDTALKHVRNGLLRKLEADATLWDHSRIYLYFAGHGFAPQGGEGALFLANAERDLLSRNLELAEYRRWCTTCAFFREVILFADCCRTRIGNYVRGYGPRLDECPAPWNGKSSTYVIGFGSTLGNPTYELPVAGDDDDARGYFTGALLEGLRGAASRDESGALTAATLSAYVRTVVAERTRERRFPQEAQIVGPLTDDVRFGTTLAPPKRVVRIALPATLMGGAVSIVKDGRQIAAWDGASFEWIVKLEDGLYEIQAERAAVANEALFKVAGEDRRVEL
jgi:hypothetical protein